MQQQPLVSDVAPSYVTHQQTLGRIVPLLPTAHKQQLAHQTDQKYWAVILKINLF
jgi:hypothetical protein